MENSKDWPKDIPFSLGFNTGYHFRGNSSPHLCWMVVAMGSWIESLAELSYFCFALAHFGFDWTLSVDHTASTTLDTEGLASRGDEFLLPSFGTLVDGFVGDLVIVNWLLLVHGWIIEVRSSSCTIDGRGDFYSVLFHRWPHPIPMVRENEFCDHKYMLYYFTNANW